MNYTIIPFDHQKFNFSKVVGDLFETDRLQDLNENHKELFQVGMDSSTSFHKKFYDKYREGWNELEEMYLNFIKEVIAPNYDEDILFQRFPTVRFHLPDNVAVGAFHNDASFGHPKHEVNYIIPLTNSYDTASVWIESEPGKGDFRAAYMVIGNLIQFNGNELTHGNKVNGTGLTRVSLDFRVLPFSKYDENGNGESITQKTKFKEGEYYNILKK